MRHVIHEVSLSCSHFLSLSKLPTTVWNSELHLTSIRCFEQLVVEIMHINVLLNLNNHCFIIYLHVSKKVETSERKLVFRNSSHNFLLQLFSSVQLLKHVWGILPLVLSASGVHGSTFGWGIALQAGRSRVRFPMVSLEFFIDIILPAALLPWGWHSL
jgi:hypothetical protein